MTRVTVPAAASAFQDIAAEKAREAAGSNGLVSRQEQKTLDPFLSEAADQVRAKGGKGTRVTVDALATEAASSAQAVWAQHNTRGPTLLSQKEIQAVAKADPSLGALSKMAYLRVSQGTGGGGAKADVMAFFKDYNFEADPEVGGHRLHDGLPGATKIDARAIFPENRATVPAGVLASFDFYDRAMQSDWATATLQKAKISGHDVYVVYTTTDGDDAYLEVLDKNGAPLVSGFLNADKLVRFDEVFGRARFQDSMVNLDEPAQVEGLSEPAERLAAGQIPADWQGDLSITQGRLHYDQFAQVGAIDLPGAAGTPQQEVALAALEYLWHRSLRYRVQGSTDPFLLGAHREGTLVVGEHTRPDGKTYQVADWRDIDDGSYTLYFDRTAEGRLRLAIEQYNN